MKPTPLLLIPLALGMCAPSLISAQDLANSTDADFRERAAAAAAAPLFAADEPIRMTLRTDIKWLRDERSDSIETDGTLEFVDLDGSMTERPVQVRARGEWRRQKRNCNFPPLRLNFPTSEMDGTVFEGQDKLKLVTPCQDSRDDYQEYILKEYLAYRTYQLITPMSYRTRLVEITYEDVNGEYDTRTKIGFLIEADDPMAHRNMAVFEDVTQFHPARLDGTAAVIASVFNFMIGSTDISQVALHNSKVIRMQDGRFAPVSYDFDLSGAVDARYAAPDKSLPIEEVTERLFRGFCRPEIQRQWVAELFLGKREAIRELYEGFELLDDDEAEDVLRFYDDFYEVLEDDRDFNRQITERCRSWD